MKTIFLVTAAAIATAVCSLASAQGFYLEAGAGYASFEGGDYTLSSILPPDPAEDTNVVPAALENPRFTEDDNASVLFIAGGYRFSEWLGLRVAYQHFGRTTSTSTADVVIATTGAEAGSVTMAYTDRVQAVSIAPELRWQASPRFALLFSPQLNWVFSDAELRTTSDSPLLQIIPVISRSRDELTLGATVGAELAMSDRLRLTAQYHYLDLDVSWGREAHVVSAGVKLEF